MAMLVYQRVMRCISLPTDLSVFLRGCFGGQCRGKSFFFPGLPHFKLLCVMPGSPTFSGTGQVQLPYREATPKICLQETGFWPGNWRFLQGGESSHEDPCRFEGWKIPDFSIGHIYVDLFMVHFSAIAV